MIIGFDAKRLFANTTGLGNYSRNLVSALGQSYPQHQYLLYTPTHPDNVSFQLGENMKTQSPSGPTALFPSVWRSYGLSKQIKKDKVEIYHGLSHELPYGIENSGVPGVLTVHDVIFKRFPSQYSPIDRWIYDRKMAYSCQVADRIIAISEQTKKDVIEFYGVAENKIEVVYQSCDASFMQAPDKDGTTKIKAKYHLPERYLLYVGSLVERKNILNLVKAFELLKDKELSLVLVGNGGSYRNKVDGYISEKKLGERIQILTEVSNDELPAMYRQAQAFVYPSLYEGFGIPIIEALWSNIPVITTKDGCFPEAGGPGSIYVDTNMPGAMADAITGVLKNDSLRKDMITAGQKYVQRFRPEIIASQVMKVYENLLAKK